jgi:squalene-associated FAD-dependent desaturase
VEVLIIGGGFAGLAAGVALAESGCRVHLLEQKPHLGGRARSWIDPTTGSVVDNGQHIVMGCYHATIRFLSTIGTLDRVRFQDRLTIHFVDRKARVSRLQSFDLPSPWHLLFGVLRSGSFTFRQKLEILRSGIALGRASETERKPQGLSVREWLTELGQSDRLQGDFWDLLCIAALNEDPAIANAALFERVLRLALFTSPADSCLGIARVGLSEVYVDAAADFIRAKGGSVECGRTVAGLRVSEGQCRGVLFSAGEQLEAENVVSAVPSFQLAPLLPGELLRREPYFSALLLLRPAPIISINLWFDRPITDLDFAGLRGATIQWLFNKGKTTDRADGCVSLVLSGAYRHIARSREELLATALAELGDFFPEVRRARMLHSLVIKERFATISPTCETEELRPATRTPIRGLFLAGDWTATGLPATIEGAVQSGYAAAREVLEGGWGRI